MKDEDEREAMWEQQHELGAQKMYSLCSELGGLFLKVGVQGASVRPVFFFLWPSPIFKLPQPHPTKGKLCVTADCAVNCDCFCGVFDTEKIRITQGPTHPWATHELERTRNVTD